MSDYVPTSSEAKLIARAEEFARRVIAPNAALWEAERKSLPRPVIQEWAALGLNALQVSEARGGGGASFHCKLRVAEAMAAHCFASAFALNNMQGSVTRMEREGAPAQIERYLPPLMSGAIICAPSLTEPGAGSDLGAITTRATKMSGGWVLDGEKAWITNGTIADQLILYAQTDPPAGLKGIASFIVDLHAPGVERLPAEILFGGAAIGASSVRMTGLHVPDDALFAPPGEAFRRALAGITGARIHVAAMICASVKNALQIAVRYGGTRHSNGKPLLDHQGLRWSLADVATHLAAAEALVSRAAVLFEAGTDAQIEAAFAKKFSVEMAQAGVAACMQAMGAAGLRAQYPLGRHLAASRIAAYVDGTTEIQNERIGSALMRRYGQSA